MNKSIVAALAAAGTLLTAGAAHAGSWSVGINLPLPRIVLPVPSVVVAAPAPVYAPVPVYSQEPVYTQEPVYVSEPAPVYYRRPPVYVRPAPVVYPRYYHGPQWRYEHRDHDRGRWDRDNRGWHRD